MTYDNYPPGMTTADLIHVGELEDPYQKFYEDFEPTDEQMEDFLVENISEFVSDFDYNKPWNKEGVRWIDLVEWFKTQNEAIVEEAYERNRDV